MKSCGAIDSHVDEYKHFLQRLKAPCFKLLLIKVYRKCNHNSQVCLFVCFIVLRNFYLHVNRTEWRCWSLTPNFDYLSLNTFNYWEKFNLLSMPVILFSPTLPTLISCICFCKATLLVALKTYRNMFHFDKIPSDSQETKKMNDVDFLSLFIQCLICTKLFT